MQFLRSLNRPFSYPFIRFMICIAVRKTTTTMKRTSTLLLNATIVFQVDNEQHDRDWGRRQRRWRRRRPMKSYFHFPSSSPFTEQQDTETILSVGRTEIVFRGTNKHTSNEMDGRTGRDRGPSVDNVTHPRWCSTVIGLNQKRISWRILSSYDGNRKKMH